MLATKIEDAKREEGFTLIELLVVVIIIGILAAIAIPVFLNQRDGARDSAVQSTLRSAATYMEIVYTNSSADTYPTADATGLTLLETEGFRSGDQVAFEISLVDNTAPQSYCLVASHGPGAVDAAGQGNFHEFRSSAGAPTAVATYADACA